MSYSPDLTGPYTVVDRIYDERKAERVDDRAVPGVSISEVAADLKSLTGMFASGTRNRLIIENAIAVLCGRNRLSIPSSVRRAVADREGQRCSYCGSCDEPLHFDHIFPVIKGGTNDPSNITLACQKCNLSKGDRTLAEWMASR